MLEEQGRRVSFIPEVVSAVAYDEADKNPDDEKDESAHDVDE